MLHRGSMASHRRHSAVTVDADMPRHNTARLHNAPQPIDVVPPLATESPLKILLMVEPTPFNYVSGYANRFKEMLKFLKEAGDDVRVLTADKDPKPPQDYMGYPISTNRGFEFILYKHVTLSFDFNLQTKHIIEDFKPDLIHVSSPSCVMWPAILWAKIYDLPLVMSYHTDFVQYSKTYGGWPGAGWLAYHVVRWFHNRADLTLCTSPQVRLGARPETSPFALTSMHTSDFLCCSYETTWCRAPASAA